MDMAMQNLQGFISVSFRYQKINVEKSLPCSIVATSNQSRFSNPNLGESGHTPDTFLDAICSAPIQVQKTTNTVAVGPNVVFIITAKHRS